MQHSAMVAEDWQTELQSDATGVTYELEAALSNVFIKRKPAMVAPANDRRIIGVSFSKRATRPCGRDALAVGRCAHGSNTRAERASRAEFESGYGLIRAVG
jgi:hypothetical protein